VRVGELLVDEPGCRGLPTAVVAADTDQPLQLSQVDFVGDLHLDYYILLVLSADIYSYTIEFEM
jgi:hypothetical protein